jgi:hypothetical protein
MKILLRAGLVRAKRIKQWTFDKRDEAGIKKVKRMIVKRVWTGSTSVPNEGHRREREVLGKMNRASYRR